MANTSNATRDFQQGFVENTCLPFLRQARNEDGGWGYRPGTASAVEPTVWCLLALGKMAPDSEAIGAGKQWLLKAQNDDGSWSTWPGAGEGNWVTALAGLALEALDGPAAAVENATRWICRSHSAEGGLRMRVGRLFARKRIVQQDFSLRGWSWTPGTSSWVEPTAVALIFLHHLPSAPALPEAAERRRMGEAMLYDRMCPSGGWNLGNPRVYGVEGIPQVGPTAWALLALQEHSEREENRRSLDWLARNLETMNGPGSVAMAHVALEACRRPAPSLEQKLTAQFQNQGFLNSVPAFAQAAFALRPGPDALRWANGQ